MPKKRVEVPLKTKLERAERKGHKKGMADLFALLSATSDGFIPDYSPSCGCCEGDDSSKFRAIADAAMLNAAEDDEIELVLFLVEAGADVDAYNEEHHTALQCAVQKGNIKLVKALLKAGASINPRDQDYDYYHHHREFYVSPLECAAEQGHLELVKILLKAGALLQDGAKAGNGRWLINYEAEGDQVELTRAFIKAGAYLGIYNNDDEPWTPLMHAISNGKTKSAALLLEAGSDVNAGNCFGDTGLMMLAQWCREEDLDNVRFLLEIGADVNLKNKKGRTALICAATTGSPEAVRLLLSAGADVFYQAPVIPRQGRPAMVAGNAFDLSTYAAVKEILKNEMHRRIAAALSVLPVMPVDVRQKIFSCTFSGAT